MRCFNTVKPQTIVSIKSLFRIAFFLLMGLMPLHAQDNQQRLSIGQWESHFPYRNGLSVTQSGDRIYYSTPLGLISFDKEDYSHLTYEKEDGLPFLNSGALEYFSPLDLVVIGYKNGLITTLKEGQFASYSDIRDYDLPIDKNINKLISKDDDGILIAANYGLTSLDLRNNKFIFTTFTDGVPVYDALVFEGKYYMATEAGLYEFDPTGGQIVQDFNAWRNILGDFGLSTKLPVKGLGVLDGSLYFGAGHKVYKIVDQSIQEVADRPEHIFSSMKQSEEALIAVFQCSGQCSKGTALKILRDAVTEVSASCIGVPVEGIVDQYGKIWMADMYDGFRLMESHSSNCKYLFPNSPFSKNVTGITFDKEGKVLVAAGGHDDTWTPRWRRDGLYTYDGTSWERISSNSNPVIKDSLFYDISQVAVHPQTGNYFIASYLSGLMEMTPDGEIVHIWNKNNSALQGTIGDVARTRISDLAFDKDNNLWICNFGAGKPLVKYASDGTWSSFGDAEVGSAFSAIDIDKNGNVWIAVASADVSRGVVVFNEGDTEVEGDEKWRVFTQSNSALPSNIVNDIEVDLDGSVWACTSLGVVTFDCEADAFEEDRCQGDRRKVVVNGIPEYLLNYEIVHTVAVDGANRKWFGTESGVYVMSPSGEELIVNYNEKNSPLPDDKVQAIDIEPKSGVVFIGTNKGLISLRTNATEAPNTFIEDIEVFPNPVRPGYSGNIYIRGLARNARVKITDLDGQIVFETTANGGIATWDGKDFNGSDVSTGVYYVFATKFEEFSSPEGAVGKLVIVR